MKRTKAKKIAIMLVAAIIIMGISAIIYAAGGIITNPTNISFEDQNLYYLMKRQLNSKKIVYNENDVTKTIEISKDDVIKIEELNLQGTEDTKIANLSGLENFTGLKSLDLTGNAIKEMASINSLGLEKLNLTGNLINQQILTSITSMVSLNELNLTNTQMNGDQLDNFSNLKNLKTLILANNNISKLDEITPLTNLTKLDVSGNKSFTNFSQIATLTNLTELNVSGTGIMEFSNISSLTELEKLYASDNSNMINDDSIDLLFEVYESEETKEDKPYLEKLKVLNLNSLGISNNKPNIRISDFTILTSLEELHLASNEISNLSDLAEMYNLKYIDLADNEIDSDELDNFIQIVDGEVLTENTLLANKIDLSGNDIIDISVFADYPADITWLDLSENHIYDIKPLSKHSFSEELYLQRQNITFGLFKKIAPIDHYIILPEILKQSQIEGSLVYADNAKLEYTGVTLNPEYTEPNQYNVIIPNTATKDDVLTIKLTGGRADGTILNFSIGSKTGAHVDCLIESLRFEDEILISKVEGLLLANEPKYFVKIPFIINIDQNAVKKVEVLDLQHTGSDVNTKIKNLTGLENFYEILTLFLQDNDVRTIDQLQYATDMQTLLLANNPNLGDNNSSIIEMPDLINLDLSNTGMTNIDNLNKAIDANRRIKMAILNLSANGLDNIDGIEKITTLEQLHISNDNLDDQDISKLGALANLTTLNINENKIENIDVISNLSNLKYLYFNKNKVESLEPIRGKTFYELEFSGNMIKDISPISSHNTINRLNMSNNKIEDVTVLRNISITDQQILSVTGQKIVRALDNTQTGVVTIELPQIFKAAKTPGDKLYTSDDLILTKCELDSTGNNIIVNVDELGGDVAQVEIYGGKANGTILTISAPIKAKIEYNPSNEVKTNQDITATISFDRSDVTITNNGGKNTYIFKQNGDFTFEYIDKYGFEGSLTAVVNNIDKQAPEVEVDKEMLDNKMVVTITANEPISAPAGWSLSSDKMSIIKTYESDITEEIQISDEAGNTTKVTVEVKIVVLSDKLTSKDNKFTITEDKQLVRDIKPKMTASQLKQGLQAEMAYTILDKNGAPVLDTAKVGTGYQIKMENGKLYTLIVWGDLDGNGEISVSELARISRIANNSLEPQGLDELAIDTSKDGKIGVNDLAIISRLKNES